MQIRQIERRMVGAVGFDQRVAQSTNVRISSAPRLRRGDAIFIGAGKKGSRGPSPPPGVVLDGSNRLERWRCRFDVTTDPAIRIEVVREMEAHRNARLEAMGCDREPERANRTARGRPRKDTPEKVSSARRYAAERLGIEEHDVPDSSDPPRREVARELVAAGDYSKGAIAQAFRVSRQTIHAWTGT